MTHARYTLAVMTSADGFIARYPGHPTHGWASPEEQTLFFAGVEAADWAIMGRTTHEAADKPERRRIIFSTSAARPEWRRPTQLWVNPESLTPADLPTLVAHIRPLRNGLILGGTRVHDWFHAAGDIAQIDLTIEPVSFGKGLPVFSGQQAGDPVAALVSAGYRITDSRPLNAGGTRFLSFLPAK
ncbi:MAG: dihydrofolate reductase family protein [Paracoccaceae bacterium]